MFAFCGRGGDGSLTTANTLAGIGKLLGVCPHGQRGVESNIKTEPTELWLRLASVPIACTSGLLDVLVAFDQSAIEDEEGEGRTLPITQMRDGGVLIYDSSPRLLYPNMKHELNRAAADAILREKKILVFGIPMAQEIMRRFGANAYVTRNAVAIGVIAELFCLPEKACRAQLAREHKGGTRLEWNIAAYEFGRQFTREQEWKLPGVSFPESAGILEECQLTLGGNAIGLGALVAGCRNYVGYPITPASEVLEYMAENMPSPGVVVIARSQDPSPEEVAFLDRIQQTSGVLIQEMSELMAINQLQGAAIAGARAMTATSGPGFSLMQEGLSAGGIGEIPLVVVLSQRGGPGTGLPTRTGQEDLLFSIFGSHGEFPKIVISPKDLKEAFLFAVEMFNIAERYQTPAILLTEQAVAQGLFCSRAFPLDQIAIDRGKLLTQEELDSLCASGTPYKRYEITEDGISRRTIPGMRGGQHLATTNEHDEFGSAIETIKNRLAMTHKRMRKFEVAAKDRRLPQPRVFGSKDARFGFITYGFPTNATCEAAAHLEEQGTPTAVLQLRTLWPFPEQAVRAFLRGKDTCFVVEQNYTKQLRRIIEMEVVGPRSRKIKSILRYDGRPITPEDVLEQVVKGGLN
ncbi:MAG: hypothetical protein A2806_03970 [Candidatus Terrybacteria bacterium RIFCSPHIGHO2_01_FULL_48_17]|uniref:2-oxoacid:acceptor oxidoreductase subunit alpha n=1 Tax=Candidatus Terrybacteria bacterium RIFCSPHIGHO2_01_FULL_48_17 TaxID=1802362 RepID=A0A1G2PKE4_9BACT|nr:MAG: hypothetical protein A2806_03970 [Candidatus Terrybacteria bacterium RIFCSPHIGHO2_01_FULL_48_17]